MSDHLDAHPEMNCATYRVEQQGAAEAVANLVLHVASRTASKRTTTRG